MQPAYQRLLLLLTLVVCLYLGSARAKPEPITRLNDTFYEPTPQDMQKVHQQFLDSKKKLNQAAPPRPAIAQTILLRNVTTDEFSAAKKLVADAHARQAVYNKWNVENPRRNQYTLKKAGTEQHKRSGDLSPPTFSQEELDAVKLVGDIETQEMHNNGTLRRYHDDHKMYHEKRQENKKPTDTNLIPANRLADTSGESWMGQVDHSQSSQPFGGDSSYKVWRNVLDYGAVGDGVHDDTAAIQKAISDGKRCGVFCPGSTVNGAVVFLPGGRTYRISSSIVLYYNTQLVGDTKGVIPTLVASSGFIGNGLLSSDVYLADGTSEWYLNTANFYRQIRNIQIDMRLATLDSVKAIHWQVAQATSIDGVSILMSNHSSTTQIGVFAENGSGGWISDMTISNGLYGFLVGSQQYSVARITIFGSQKCIGMIWDWSWSWSQLRLESCGVGIDLTAPGSNSKAPVGSLNIIDTEIIHCTSAIKTYHFASTSSEQGTTVISLNNVIFYGCDNFILFPDNTALNQQVQDWTVNYWQFGDAAHNNEVHDGFTTTNVTRPASMVGPEHGQFFSRGKPSYYKLTIDSVVNAKIHAKGDGVTDDSSALQSLINYCAANSFLLYLPAGSYMISSPLLIPTNTFIYGEAWSQLVAYGPKFADANNPRAMITVGQGETNGVVELQNLLFTSRGSLPGLTLLQWDIRAASQGSVGLWDCHFRVGGAKGTDLQKANCPKLSGGVKPECIAAALLMVMTDTSNGYFENMWAWVADHDIDDPATDDANQIDVYVSRGIIIRGDGPTWFRGTASEHSTIYQYNIIEASNLYMSIIQTESPYYQGAAHLQAPAPFTLGNWIGDPAFDMCGSDTTNCNAAWAVLIQHSNMVFIDGAGLYSWFQNYDQACVNTKNCQQRLINVLNTGNMLFTHIVTIGSVEIVTPAISNKQNGIIYAEDALEATGFPWWTTIASYFGNTAPVNHNTRPFPIRNGWAAFGDSFAAGIGTGANYDSDADSCHRGTGGYPTYMDTLVTYQNEGYPSDFQLLACSGEVGADFFGGGTQQLHKWNPAATDVVTVSFFGNDLNFGGIVSACVVGYDKGISCEDLITRANDILDKNHLAILFTEIVGAIFDKAKTFNQRLVVYWTGYPKFYDVSTTDCDDCRFWVGYEYWNWKGELMTQDLRNRLNNLAVRLNGVIRTAADDWNRGKPYPQVVFVNVDNDRSVYAGRRFCQPGIKEPLKDDLQNRVAFFYQRGPDDIPTDVPLHAPRQGAASGWPIITINSDTCRNESLVGADHAICDMAIEAAADSSQLDKLRTFLANNGDGDSTVTLNSDGSVSITEVDVKYAKMYHPKARANLAIARSLVTILRDN